MTTTKASRLLPGFTMPTSTGPVVVVAVRYSHRSRNGEMVTTARVETACGKIIETEVIFD